MQDPISKERVRWINEQFQMMMVIIPPLDDHEPPQWTKAEQIEIRSSFGKKFPIKSTLIQVQSYEDRTLQRYIREKIVPIDELTLRVMERSSTNEMERKDLFLLELLNWFKDEFFTWFDQSDCDQCGKAMKFLRYSPPTDQERSEGEAQRVEVYQ